MIEGTPSTDIAQKGIEIIPKNTSGEITLNIEEIQPLDVFYSPKHRAVVRKQRIRRKIDQTSSIAPQSEFMNLYGRIQRSNLLRI